MHQGTNLDTSARLMMTPDCSCPPDSVLGSVAVQLAGQIQQVQGRLQHLFPNLHHVNTIEPTPTGIILG